MSKQHQQPRGSIENLHETSDLEHPTNKKYNKVRPGVEIQKNEREKDLIIAIDHHIALTVDDVKEKTDEHPELTASALDQWLHDTDGENTQTYSEPEHIAGKVIIMKQNDDSADTISKAA